MSPSSRPITWLAAGTAIVAAAALTFACSGGSSSPSNTSTTAATTTTTTAASTTTTTVGATTTTIPSLTARFTVASLSAAQRKTSDGTLVTILPAGTADACPLVNSSNPVLDCRFDASTSTGPITRYVWTYSFGTKQQTEETTTPQLKPTANGCGFFGGQATSTGGGLQFIGMKVDLQVRDASGNAAAVFTNQNVRIFPAGNCGYGF